MITKKAIAAGAIAAALTASAAAAAQFELFGQAEGWNVFTKTDDKTCVIETRRDDLIVQMGVFANQEVGYIGVFTHEPDGVNASATGNFIVDFDGEVFAADEVIMEGNDQGYSGVYIKGQQPELHQRSGQQENDESDRHRAHLYAGSGWHQSCHGYGARMHRGCK